MRAWYDIFGTPQARREDEAGLRESQALVEALIARERERGVPASRIVLMGFSQGCAMTLLTGLRHGERLAGLVGLSGYLPLAAAPRPSAAPPTPTCRSSWPMARDDPMIAHRPRAGLARRAAWRWATRSSGMTTRCRIRCAWTRSPT